MRATVPSIRSGFGERDIEVSCRHSTFHLCSEVVEQRDIRAAIIAVEHEAKRVSFLRKHGLEELRRSAICIGCDRRKRTLFRINRSSASSPCAADCWRVGFWTSASCWMSHRGDETRTRNPSRNRNPIVRDTFLRCRDGDAIGLAHARGIAPSRPIDNQIQLPQQKHAISPSPAPVRRGRGPCV